MSGSKPKHRPEPPSLENPKTEVVIYTLHVTTEEWQAKYAEIVDRWGQERVVVHGSVLSLFTERPILGPGGMLILQVAWPYNPEKNK